MAKTLQVGLLTGGIDKPYVFGLSLALASKDVGVDLIGSDEVDAPELHTRPGIRFLNLRGDQSHDASVLTKVARVLVYYARLVRYALVSKAGVFHVLWNNRFEVFDRTLLLLFYRLLGKKIVLTAHNINTRKRDGTDSVFNRLTLKIQYRLADHIFVHTQGMKAELLKDYGVRERATTVIPLGFNNSVPHTQLTSAEARQALGIAEDEKAILFFGRIGPYKGLEHLVAAFQQLASRGQGYRLIVVGEPKIGSEQYVEEIRQAIRGDVRSSEAVIQRIEFVRDDETEIYFKAADVLALPYTQAYQSGVLVLSYTFGLPVIAADIGSFRDDVVEGKTGFMSEPANPRALADAIEKYFESDLFRTLPARREEIEGYARANYSWDMVGETTRNVYLHLLPASVRTTSAVAPPSAPPDTPSTTFY